jgi:kynurenine formamidase
MKSILQTTLAAALVVGLGFVSTVATAADKRGTLAEALETIQGKEFVDLTQSFSPTTPVWSGFGQATMSAASDPKTHRPYTIDKDGFRSIFYSLVGQYGTHVDPPAHFSADGMTMDQIPLKQMILPLVVFDMTPIIKTDENHALTVDDIKAWEKAHGQVPAGSFAALRTDMYKDWDSNPERFKRAPFPAWSLAAIKFLFDERKVTAIGHEALDTDTTETMASETWLLQQNHFQIEVMANLDKVPATGAVIVVTWPKVEGGFGFPARAFAILP